MSLADHAPLSLRNKSNTHTPGTQSPHPHHQYVNGAPPAGPPARGLPPCFSPLPFLFPVFPILSLFPHNKYQNGFIKSIQPNSHVDWLGIGSFVVIYILPWVKLLRYLKFFLPLIFFYLTLLHKTSRNNCILYTPPPPPQTQILII